LGLADITADDVLAAVAEFDRIGRDAFLARYEFKPAREYFLVVGGRHYDSKAICGAAHGYSRSDSRPLKAQEFSGGYATVQRRLEDLGFRVERLGRGAQDEGAGGTRRNPPWDDRELILALDLYLREGMRGSTDAQVIALSEMLDRLPIHAERPDAVRFRDPNGVALKLAHFAAIDPSIPGKGMQRGGRREKEIWEMLAGNEDLLAEAAARIRKGRDWKDLVEVAAGPSVVERLPVEVHHTDRFAIDRSGGAGQGERREQPLVLEYTRYLEGLGHRVCRHLYRGTGIGSRLSCDLVDETEKVLYEAKSDTRRESIRMAVGQLYDYRRFEPATMTMAVLLPRRPGEDLIAYLASIDIRAVWKTRDGFERSGP
jgi:hypothetical protein